MIRGDEVPKAKPVTKIIHVSPSTIRDNWKAIEEDRLDDIRPAVVIQFAGNKMTAYRVDILGPSRVIQNDTNGQDGARVWIETESEIELHASRQDTT